MPHSRDGCAPAGAFVLEESYGGVRVILFTVLLLKFATHMLVPSKSMPAGFLSTG